MEVCLPIVWGSDWRGKNKMKINHGEALGCRRTARAGNNQLKIGFDTEDEYGQDVLLGGSEWVMFFIVFGER